jgi:hypothetical protein
VIWLWIGVAVVVVAAGAVLPVLVRRRGRGSAAEIGARERYELLGSYVADNPSLHRARERWDTAGALLASARSAEDFALAERICAEGLAHVRKAR